MIHDHFVRLLFGCLLLVLPGLSLAGGSPSDFFEALGQLFFKSAQAADLPNRPLTQERVARPVSRVAATPQAERRVALVIGNNAYRRVEPLNNAVPDALAMAHEFRALGFEVIERTDVDQRAMKAAVREFVDKIAQGGFGAFFYAGHGVQSGGNNYLVPVDVDALSDPRALRDEAVELNSGVIQEISDAKARFSLLVIDACRNNPFPKRSGRSTVGAIRGLELPRVPDGMVVVYSAGPGQAALDRLGPDDRHPNGLFTREFIREMRTPGLEIADLVRNVHTRVKAQAAKVKHEQSPGLYIQTAEKVYLFPKTESVVIQAPSADPDPDAEAWTAANSVRSVTAYRAYLEAYPQGRYATAARIKLQALQDSGLTGGAAPPALSAPAAKTALTPPAAATPISPRPLAESTEQDFWSQAQASGAREHVEAYLKKYPKGKFLSQARLELKRIAGEEKAAKARQEGEQKAAAQSQALADREAWEAAKSLHNEAAYRAYLERYPQGRFQQEVRSNLAALGAEEALLRPGRVFQDCPDCPEMVVIRAGSFEMGSDNGDADEKPVHTVRIGKPFALAKTEVTQAQWRAIMGNDPSHFSRCGDSCPVENVSWEDAQEYLRKLSEKTGKNYRLPSEAEWEYACRAGGDHGYCGGDNVDELTWYDKNSDGKTHPVASRTANAWGLYDMSGNVAEWVEDCWNSNYQSAPSDGTVWASGNCGQRVLRGGSWLNYAKGARAATRDRNGSAHRDYYDGFRPARMLP